MPNDVTVLLDALYERKLTLNEVVARFKGRSWPDARADFKGSVPEGEGRYQDVTDAYEGGRLTDDQYPALVEAIMESVEAGQ
jgi:hypothetical protein